MGRQLNCSTEDLRDKFLIACGSSGPIRYYTEGIHTTKRSGYGMEFKECDEWLIIMEHK